MKKLLLTTALACVASLTFAQGRVNFSNSSTTLISAGGATAPSAATSSFVYAIFVAPSGTVENPSVAPTFLDPLFQQAGAYNVNHPTAAGRLTIVNGAEVAGAAPGGTVDFIIRGWSANAGATWAEALANWNGGNALVDMYLGSSGIANNLVLGDGGAIAAKTVFGVGTDQVGGFNMAFYQVVPEPSSMALAGLGAAALVLFRRRK